MSAHYEIAALFLQFENPWLRCPNSRSFFFLPNSLDPGSCWSWFSQSMKSELLISSASLWYFWPPQCSHILRRQCQASHPPTIHFQAWDKGWQKGSASPPVTLLSRNNILRTPPPKQFPLPSPEPLLCHLIPRIAPTFLRSRDLFPIPKERLGLC